MGNAISPNIVLEHEDEGHYKAIVAGSLLAGRVVFKVNEPIIPAKITLVVEGKEKTTANADSDDDDSVWNDKICFFRKKVDLPTIKHDWGDVINPGTYVFPFEASLPASLPSTSGFNFANAGYEIEYTLKLKSKPKHAFANKRTFFVASDHVADDVVPCLYQPQPIRVDKFGIVGSGFFSMGMRLDNTQVGRGGALSIYLACRNEATVPVQKVEVKLIQEVHWKAQTQGDDGIEVLAKLDDVNLPGLKRDSIKHFNLVDLNTTQHKESTGYSIYVDLMAKENRVSLIVPTLALDSFTGLKVKISHYVRVTLVTMATAGNPSTQVPIKIGHSSRLAGQRSIALSSIPSLPTMPALPKVSEEGAIQRPLSEPRKGQGVDKIQDYDQVSKCSVEFDDEPSLEELFHEMAAAVNDYDVIASKIQNIEWAVLLADLTPEDYGTIIGHVTLDFSQTRVAVFLAKQIAESFTCEHCVAAIQNATMPFRPNMVEALLPYCVDLPEHHELIRAQLSEFEQVVVTQRTFDEPSELQSTVDGTRSMPVPSAAPDEHEPAFTDDPYGGVRPRDEDICFSSSKHPGTKDLIAVVRKCLTKFEEFAYSPPVYKTIRRKLNDRRFLIRQGGSQWREATKIERIETIGNYFDQEKELSKKNASKSKKKAAKNIWDQNEENEWEYSRREAKDNWNLAMSVHSYDGNDDMHEEGPHDGPSKYDICLHDETHAGNFALRRAIKAILPVYVDVSWSPPVYRAIKAKLKGRQFFIWDIDDGRWRNAEQTERVEYFGKIFEAQRLTFKLDMKKDKRHSQTTSAAHAASAPTKKKKTKSKAPSQKQYDGGNMVVEYDASRSMNYPQSNDICFGEDDHPGTEALDRVIKKLMEEYWDVPWSPPIYKAIRRNLRGRRFFVRLGSVWREANQEDRLDQCEDRFELERQVYKERMHG